MAKTAKQKAAEQAAEKINSDRVMVRVTKLGDGEVSTGEHIAGEGDLMYEKGDKVSLPRQVAEELEGRGFVEIEDEAPEPTKRPYVRKPVEDQLATEEVVEDTTEGA